MPKPNARLKTLANRVQATAPSRVAVVQPGSWRTDKQTSSQRGYDYRWQKARALFLREHPLCVYCEREGRVTAATIVDHIEPHRGDTVLFWNRDNWQGLCKTHHASQKRREEARG